jgi:hypothetical protein
MEVGMGAHGSLSKYDMGNTLVAAGPDFKSGFVNKLPSANSDVAPTVAKILNLPADSMQGRVLTEALRDAPSTDSESPQTTIMQAKRTLGEKRDKLWQQYLKVTTYQNQRYYDEGNTGAPPETGMLEVARASARRGT